MKGIPRFIKEFKEYLKFNQGEDDRMDNIADIGKIITRSVEYIAIKTEMHEKVRRDFTTAAAYVEENYKKVREIIQFMNDFVPPDWKKDSVPFEEIKEKITKFNNWNNDIKTRIKDIAKGTLNINGSKIATKLTHFL